MQTLSPGISPQRYKTSKKFLYLIYESSGTESWELGVGNWDLGEEEAKNNGRLKFVFFLVFPIVYD